MPRPRVVGPPTANHHLKLGFNAIADLLAPTLGPIGGLVANEKSIGRTPELLDDSATIVRRILSLGDQRRDIGAMLMRNLVWRVTQRAGDGGAMTAVLARAMYHEALRLVTAGANPMLIAQGVDKAVMAVLEALHQQARPVNTEDDLAALALTIVYEKPLAAVLGEMSCLLGADAHVIITDHVAPFLQRRYIAGAHYPAEIASLHFYTQPLQKRALASDSLVALVDDALKEVDQIVPILRAAAQTDKKGLTILVPSISEAPLAVLVANQQAPDKKLSFLAVKLKDVTPERLYTMADLELLTGATILGSNYERTTKTLRLEDLGYAQRIEISEGSLVVVTDSFRRPDVQAEVIRLRNRLAASHLDAADRPLLIRRIAALTGGVGELKIGAAGKQERQVLHSRTERALRVLSAAQRGGVVAGGGAALHHCIPALQDLELEGDANLGVRLVANTLSAPLQQILHNGWVPESSLIMKQVSEAGPQATFDVLTGRLVDACSAGLVDAVDVLKTVVRTAASGAMSAITTDTIVYHRQPEQSERLEP